MFFPLIGLIVGAVQWLVFYMLRGRLPLAMVSVFVIITLVFVTGALHIDGLGDTCDGFFAFKGRDRIIEIMKDSRIGTYACIAIVTDLLLRAAAISSLSTVSFSLIIIAAPIVGRTMFVLLFYIGKPAKANGSGNLFIGNTGLKELIAAFIIGITVVLALLGVYKGIILILTGIIIVFLFNRYCVSKIGGLTGDTLGACNEIIELMTLVIFIALCR